jgi:Tol biopolymer transport system component
VRKAAVSGALILAMCAFGFGVYVVAGHLRGGRSGVVRPTSTTAPALPGTIYLTQEGAIYRFQRGGFRQITGDDGWMQPAASPDGSELVAVKRSLNRSDLYLLGPTGRQEEQLTHDGSSQVELNHWAFWPRFGRDGSSVFFSYDPKDPYNSYRVDLAIFSTPADPSGQSLTQWTSPKPYTGGDVTPIPLRDGDLLYTKFSIDVQSKVHSQVWLQSQPGGVGVGLTPMADDCGQPAVSPDEKWLAMVCRHGGLASTDLEVAALDVSASSIGSPSVVVHGQLMASPTFSPDGTLLAYLAPTTAIGPFQLWTAQVTASSKPSPPREITTDLDLDASSAPIWMAS